MKVALLKQLNTRFYFQRVLWYLGLPHKKILLTHTHTHICTHPHTHTHTRGSLTYKVELDHWPLFFFQYFWNITIKIMILAYVTSPSDKPYTYCPTHALNIFPTLPVGNTLLSGTYTPAAQVPHPLTLQFSNCRRPVRTPSSIHPFTHLFVQLTGSRSVLDLKWMADHNA